MTQKNSITASSNLQEPAAPLLQLPRIKVTSRGFGTGLEFSESPEDETGPSPEAVQKIARGNVLIALEPVRILHF